MEDRSELKNELKPFKLDVDICSQNSLRQAFHTQLINLNAIEQRHFAKEQLIKLIDGHICSKFLSVFLTCLNETGKNR
jgi:hypothetical protein